MLLWLHLLSTETRTWYGVHKKRGQEALDYFDILPEFKNRLVHDCWKTYFDLACMHALWVFLTKTAKGQVWIATNRIITVYLNDTFQMPTIDL